MAGDIWRSSDASRTSIVQHWCSELVLWRFIIILLSLLSIFCSSSASDSYQNGHSPDFSSFKVIKPRVFHGRHKREIFDTRENEHEHTEVLTIAYDIDGVKRTLDLRLNTDLIPVGYKQRRQHNGGYKTDIPDKVELCHYQGSVRGIPGSWVALSTCRGLKGVVFDGENTHYIHPEAESLDAIHYLYDHKHFIGNNTCGYKGHHEASIPSIISHKNFRRKRAAEVVRGPYNSNRQSRYVELVLVIDKKEYMALGENLDKVYHHCKDIANIINALFTPLNIFVALVGVEVWTDSDEITLSPKGDATLANFLRYRREMLVKEIPNDNAQLLTKAKFEEGVVGKALKGPICTFEFSGGVSIDHSSVIGIVAATVAHEMGHNFGMEHDSANCSCPEERCIMAASSGSTGPVHWSSCSLEYLALAFEHGMDYCLRNKPTKLFDSPICGNGFVESGEQCDCGLKENCDNPCCNATTCMLHSNASCATGKCCDLTTCKPKNAGTECRSAEHECDLPEYCTGQSEYCPQDVFKIDGESCNVGKAFCYQGSCRTHNDQCKLLWGPSGFSSDAQCYHMNSKGTKLGNCGYNRLESSYIKCNDEHILCGMLHCKHLNERLEFGMESVAILSHSFINNGGKIIACRSAIVDLGLNQVDPGLAPDGAKCAPGKMCVNQKCMPIADLRASTIGKDSCPNNCGGNGVCNSLGHCHCNRGFRPPDCVHPGFGGSDDSGPAEDPNARNDFITALYVIFLGILPVAGLVSLAVWCRNNNSPGTIGWKKQIIPTYVFNLEKLVSKSKKPINFPGRTPKKSKTREKNKFVERLNILFSFSKHTRPNQNQIFTISDTLPRKKIEITKKNLVSTTNPEVINCSNQIVSKHVSLFENLNSQNTVTSNSENPIYMNVSKKNLPDKLREPAQTSECKNDKIFKNVHELKLNPYNEFQYSNENPCSSSNVANLKSIEQIKDPILFYNKKPPPPPAPPQSMKPKI